VLEYNSYAVAAPAQSSDSAYSTLASVEALLLKLVDAVPHPSSREKSSGPMDP